MGANAPWFAGIRGIPVRVGAMLISRPFLGKQVARRRNKSEERDVAQARVGRLLALGRAELLAGRADLADRYAGLGLRVAQRYQTGLAPSHKAQVCRKCGALRCAATSRTRVRAGRLAVTCLRCGHVARRPLAGRPPAPTGAPSRSPEA